MPSERLSVADRAKGLQDDVLRVVSILRHLVLFVVFVFFVFFFYFFFFFLISSFWLFGCVRLLRLLLHVVVLIVWMRSSCTVSMPKCCHSTEHLIMH